MKTVALYDVDSRIPNLALMKLSARHKARGWSVQRVRHSGEAVPADAHFAATIFHIILLYIRPANDAARGQNHRAIFERKPRPTLRFLPHSFPAPQPPPAPPPAA